MKIVICKGPPSLHAILAVMLAFFIFLFAWEYRNDKKFQAEWSGKWDQMSMEHKAKYQELEQRIKLEMERWAELKAGQKELREAIEEKMEELEDMLDEELSGMDSEIDEIKIKVGLKKPEPEIAPEHPDDD